MAKSMISVRFSVIRPFGVCPCLRQIYSAGAEIRHCYLGGNGKCFPLHCRNTTDLEEKRAADLLREVKELREQNDYATE
jgi:hypothetical protein